jgi:signal transduction histidine kinase
MGLVASDELWLRLAWFVRLRWSVPPMLVLLGVAVNAWMGPVVPLRQTSALLALVWISNAAYVACLRRWRSEVTRRGRELHALAHAQVAIDIAIMNGAMSVTGGGVSPFWPFLCLTLFAAGLFFAQVKHVVGYAVLTLASFAIMSALHGAVQPTLLLLTILLGSIGFISVYFAGRMNELLRIREEARKKDLALSLVSHELRNPLASLKASVHLAKRPGNKDQMLRRIDASVEHMVRIVSDLYDVSSVQTGQLRIEPRAADLVTIVGEVVERFRELHPFLQIEIDRPPAAWGSWDADRLDQLLSNLLQNAAKYAGEAAAVRISISPEANNTVHLSMRDNGPGIPVGILPTIFEPFQRADDKRKRGLGLGLALAREIATLHGGAIWVESHAGAGTTFHLRLPTSGANAPS